MSNKVIGIDPDSRLSTDAREVDGWLAEKVNRKQLNQILFQSVTDHVWGTENQVKVSKDAGFYTDGAGLPFDANDAAVIINEDDKILIKHDTPQTANLLLDCGGKKVTIEMYGGITLDMDTFDLTLGGTGDSIGGDIRITQTGELSIIGNRGLMINNSRDVYEDFKEKNLILDVFDNTNVKATADNIIFVDKFGGGKRVNDISLNWDSTISTGDIVGGLGPKNSHWYGTAADSDLNVKLLLDSTGTSGTASVGFLVWASGTAATDLYKAGDTVYNTTQKTTTTISTTPTIDGDPIALTDDIFATSDTFLIKMQSPVGLGDSWARVGSVFVNSSGNFDDSTYTHIQEPTLYFGDIAGLLDYVITGPAGLAIVSAETAVYQENDWVGVGQWKIDGELDYSFTSTASANTTMSGVNFLASWQSVASFSSALNNWTRGAAQPGSNILVATASAATTKMTLNFNINVSKKPTFHL